MKQSHIQCIGTPPIGGVNMTMTVPIGIGTDGCAAICPEERNSNPTDVRESNRVSHRVLRALSLHFDHINQSISLWCGLVNIITVSLLFILSVGIPCYALEYSGEEAVQKVIEQLDPTEKDNYLFYYGDYSSSEWLVFVDLDPNANWEHQCKYYYLTKSSENEIEITRIEDNKFPPNIDLTLCNKFTHKSISDFPIFLKISKRETEEKTNEYAIIISGGGNTKANRYRYWTDCSYIYGVLRNHYNIPKDNIFISLNNGISDEPAYEDGLTTMLDLDLDNVDEYIYPAKRQSIKQIIDSLSVILTQNDRLFVYVIDHGGLDKTRDESYIVLWDEERLYASEFSEWIEKINCQSISFLFGQCNSGGFIEYLKKDNYIVSTACKKEESSYGGSVQPYDEFVYEWTAAMHNIQTKPKADIDNDYLVSMYEAHLYACNNDEYGPNYQAIEHPQFYAKNETLAHDICFGRGPQIHVGIKDENEGLYIIPDNIDVWNSPSINIRKSTLSSNDFQNPYFSSFGTGKNLIYTTVSNIGMKDYFVPDPLLYLNIYWSIGTPIASKYCYAGKIHDENSEKLGGYIGDMEISSDIYALEDITLIFPWTSLKSKYVQGDPINIACIIADKPDVFSEDIKDFSNNTQNAYIGNSENFNIAEKHLYNVKPTSFGQFTVDLAILNPFDIEKNYIVSVSEANNDIENLGVSIDLPTNIYEILSYPTHGTYNPVQNFYANSNGPIIDYLNLSPKQLFYIKINGTNNSFVGKHIIVSLINKDNGKTEGSYHLNILPKNTVANNVSIEVSNVEGSIYSLELESNIDNSEIIGQEWFDSNGKLLGSDSTLELNIADNSNSIFANLYCDNGILSTSIDIDNLISIENIIQNENQLKINLSNNPIKDIIIGVARINKNNHASINSVNTESKEQLIECNWIEKGDELVIYIYRNDKILDSKTIIVN